MITHGIPAVFGLAPILPLVGFPAGKVRIRQREDEFTRVYIRTVEGIREFTAIDAGDHWTPGPETARNTRPHPVRELMTAVEYMRRACEHAQGRTTGDEEMLWRASRVGIRINKKYADQIDGYKGELFWQQVNELPSRLGLAPSSANSNQFCRSH